MSENIEEHKKNHKRKNNKVKRKMLLLTSVSLNDLGWFSSMYFWWVEPNLVGLALAIACIFVSDLTLAILEY